MSSQKRVTIAACALFIMLGFLSGGLANSGSAPKEAESRTMNEITEEEAPALAEKEPTYTLKIQDGVLVVYSEADDTRPIIVTDIYASTLRHLDREQLSEGITVSGEIELQALLEDFSS